LSLDGLNPCEDEGEDAGAADPFVLLLLLNALASSRALAASALAAFAYKP
jgi:hypothetical protein